MIVNLKHDECMSEGNFQIHNGDKHPLASKINKQFEFKEKVSRIPHDDINDFIANYVSPLEILHCILNLSHICICK